MFRYIGNKSKLTTEVMNKTAEIIGEHGTVVDLMAGTGTVAMEYRRRGYHVIASDIMTYSKHHLITQLLFDHEPEFEGLKFLGKDGLSVYESVIDYLNNLIPMQGYFFQEFSSDGVPANGCDSRKYFTSSNASKIDAVRNKINTWVTEQKINENEESVLKHTIIMAVNRVANISGTYGYYLSSFKKNSLENFVLTPYVFENIGNTNHTILQGFAEDISHTITADLCYIDPPYMKRQYAANYHILETIARGDFPEAVGKSGLRDWWDQHSKFCTKTRSADSFAKVIADMNCNHFLISYSEDGLLTVDQLVELFSKFGEVVVNEINHTRFRSNQSLLPKNIKEYIFEVHKN